MCYGYVVEEKLGRSSKIREIHIVFYQKKKKN